MIGQIVAAYGGTTRRSLDVDHIAANPCRDSGSRCASIRLVNLAIVPCEQTTPAGCRLSSHALRKSGSARTASRWCMKRSPAAQALVFFRYPIKQTGRVARVFRHWCKRVGSRGSRTGISVPPCPASPVNSRRSPALCGPDLRAIPTISSRLAVRRQVLASFARSDLPYNCCMKTLFQLVIASALVQSCGCDFRPSRLRQRKPHSTANKPTRISARSVRFWQSHEWQQRHAVAAAVSREVLQIARSRRRIPEVDR